jgi:hydroxyacylglutathione hydrolase
MAGSFPTQWIHGSPGCIGHRDEPIQVHAYDDSTFILRESKCADPEGTPARPGPSFEAPFMYLLFGEEKALLLDTGATRSPERLPIGARVGQLIDTRRAARGGIRIPLLACHSHSHGDHFSGDGQFRRMAHVTVVEPSLDAVVRFFGIADWPNQIVTLELGNRTLDVIPIPGHEESHIALYDRNTRLLLSGDTLYPGLLFVEVWDDYQDSVERLAAFVEDRGLQISHILGAHIEMKSAPGKFFGYPHPFFQDGEHVLQLEARHLVELREAIRTMGPTRGMARRADFILFHDDPRNIPPEDP